MNWRHEIQILSKNIDNPPRFLDHVIDLTTFEHFGHVMTFTYFVFCLLRDYPTQSLAISWVLIKRGYKYMKNKTISHFNVRR